MIKLKVECREANHICDKKQYKEASLREKIVLTFHLLYCRACRKYTARNTKLTKLVKNPRVETLNTSAKHKLQQAFKAELRKQQ
ncbi:MAG: hypothetical protein HKP48_09415 [Winogradskyella sp.]|uniref:hypothetical protein n=1 Tax=Winogradskyella sp. TaxID=1883156 RepID=UPI0017EB66C6|nr:hypothetical protein [Winogradskyella sp.]MBT8244039.1 hypothetical protein [Winogradskyella sp.]NNK23489.1 hypothetical protein [Winogradskyella sp.]